MSDRVDPTPTPRAALLEVMVGTALAGGCIAAVEVGGRLIPGADQWAGVAVAVCFLGLPLLFAQVRGFHGDPLGIGRAPLGAGVALGVAASLVIAAPFVLGYDRLATQVLNQARFAGPGLLSYGEAFQGAPSPAPDHVAVTEEGHGLSVRNHTAHQLRLNLEKTQQNPAKSLVLQPNRQIVLLGERSNSWALARADGAAIGAETVQIGGAQLPPMAVDGAVQTPRGVQFRLSRGYGWLLWALLSQLLMVALPEEAFFRGWVLGRLRQAWPTPRRAVFGVPFGAPHVISAALFAAIHLVVAPSPGRLLVFFPGLLFAWLAERSRAIVASTVNHALSNLLLRVATRTYL